MSNYTSGPWQVKPNSVGGPTVGPEGSVVADIRTYGGPHVGGRQHPQTDANARLIAAAPDLLEALQEVVAGDAEEIEDAKRLGVPFPDEMLAAYHKARAAIAKATGEQP